MGAAAPRHRAITPRHFSDLVRATPLQLPMSWHKRNAYPRVVLFAYVIFLAHLRFTPRQPIRQKPTQSKAACALAHSLRLSRIARGPGRSLVSSERPNRPAIGAYAVFGWLCSNGLKSREAVMLASVVGSVPLTKQTSGELYISSD